MHFTRIIYQPFKHKIVSGSVYGANRFVFAVSLGEGSELRSQLEEMSVEITNGEIPATDEIINYLDGVRKSFSVIPKCLWGTPFEKRVWCETKVIPFGETISYGELAHRVGNPKAMRAVGHALGKNPLALIVPCHRVIRSDGALGGFGGGLDLKKKLLELEKSLYFFS